MDWSISKLLNLRQCHRKFYFAHELASHHFTHPVRRKAFELTQSKSLKMWQGSLVDFAFSEILIAMYQNKEVPDFSALANEITDIASLQYEFSRKQLYRQKGMSKTKAGEEFLVLDIHERGLPYCEDDISEIYATVSDIIMQIPEYGSPEAGKSLHEYLMTSNFLRPNINYWHYQFEDMRIKPQIDLVRYRGKAIHVIDWKVSDSDSSDYSMQLYLAGIVAYHNIKKDFQAKGWDLPKMEDVSLFEINLMNGNIKEHAFSRESTAAALDYVYRFRNEQEQLSSVQKWDELNIEDYQTTDKKETCALCKFKPLCIHLILNNFRYDEREYYQLVQNQQLA
ncbi:PD-(D/E)XK nuclease family protein [Paraflavitalea sp. CAU 1676]|uniref:PD-(D/E)XK nuclease family protein n=1 Tax=Paraflavitalea sp. CAU 1676 TaxID=3032598 RepID=UPI0023DAFC8A|nr:PD-(D/E)XK nuclease family protein [Paraflavitalea sp. CAU 1676]MDF2188326.1 PD-(D/E)XK nuclease family protein [Paraflavitalea sp. CAU 1676]